MTKIKDKTLIERIEKLERDVATLKSQRKTTNEKSFDDEWYIRTWDHKVR